MVFTSFIRPSKEKLFIALLFFWVMSSTFWLLDPPQAGPCPTTMTYETYRQVSYPTCSSAFTIFLVERAWLFLIASYLFSCWIVSFARGMWKRKRMRTLYR